MALDRSAMADEKAAAIAKAKEHYSTLLEQAVTWQDANKDVHVRSIKATKRGASWLLVVSATVGGKQVVAFRDVGGLDDLASEAYDIMSTNTWRPDKFAQPVSKP